MNNKIVAFSKQAMKHAFDIKHEDRSLDYHAEYDKKFAELILQECLHIIDEEGCGEGGSIRAMRKIKEQFNI